jgi:hypothetical protein
MTAADEQRSGLRASPRRHIGTIRRKNVERDGGHVGILFQRVDSDGNLIAGEKPCIVVQADEIVFGRGAHPEIARRHVTSIGGPSRPRHVRKLSRELWRAVRGRIVDHFNTHAAIALFERGLNGFGDDGRAIARDDSHQNGRRLRIRG